MTRDIGMATEEELLNKHREALNGKSEERQIELLHQWWVDHDRDWIVFELMKGWDQEKRLQVLQDYK